MEALLPASAEPSPELSDGIGQKGNGHGFLRDSEGCDCMKTSRIHFGFDKVCVSHSAPNLHLSNSCQLKHACLPV